jgi:hypothetical protein
LTWKGFIAQRKSTAADNGRAISGRVLGNGAVPSVATAIPFDEARGRRETGVTFVRA